MVRSSTTATGAHGMPVTVGIVMETDERGLLRRGCPVQELERVRYRRLRRAERTADRCEEPEGRLATRGPKAVAPHRTPIRIAR